MTFVSQKSRGNYRCSKCNVPKKGHICPYQPRFRRRDQAVEGGTLWFILSRNYKYHIHFIRAVFETSLISLLLSYFWNSDTNGWNSMWNGWRDDSTELNIRNSRNFRELSAISLNEYIDLKNWKINVLSKLVYQCISQVVFIISYIFRLSAQNVLRFFITICPTIDLNI